MEILKLFIQSFIAILSMLLGLFLLLQCFTCIHVHVTGGILLNHYIISSITNS